MNLEEMAKISIILVGLWLLVSWSGLLDTEYTKYKDSKQYIDTRVDDLVSRMTLEEKIGQMLQIERKYASADLVCRDPRWGRCYESYSEDPKLVQDMTEIIPGLQGDVPDNLPKGVPFITGK
ncbi:hypothetical protein Fmac_028195 [Flemingia macrophylla]|uniref:Uncharacterized protein n=1 Tax=Flemingia macrophylla TaxID=520843 RepID=A0ABD1L6T9_9FABA